MLKNIFGIPVRKSVEIRKSRSRTLFWGGFDGCTLIAPRTLDGGLQSYKTPKFRFGDLVRIFDIFVIPEYPNKGRAQDQVVTKIGPRS